MHVKSSRGIKRKGQDAVDAECYDSVDNESAFVSYRHPASSREYEEVKEEYRDEFANGYSAAEIAHANLNDYLPCEMGNYRQSTQFNSITRPANAYFRQQNDELPFNFEVLPVNVVTQVQGNVPICMMTMQYVLNPYLFAPVCTTLTNLYPF